MLGNLCIRLGWFHEIKILKSRKSSTNTSVGSSASDLQRYLDQPLLEFIDDEDSFDILAWWKTQVNNYSVLSSLACDIFTVPVSIVSLESAFSAGGQTLSDSKKALAPNTIEALICLKD